MAHFDTVILHGSVVDGTGRPPRKADVGIDKDRIAAVGSLQEATAERRIDASGLVVAPGFIDIHHHASSELIGGIARIPMADNMLRQGVTTIVGGNCGGSPVPLSRHLEKVSKLEIRQNYACLAGVGSSYVTALRKLRVKNWGPRTEKAYVRQIEQDFDAGAVGLSSGLVYTPHITTETVIAGARVAARYNSFYVSHLRNENDLLLGGVEELVFICRTAGLPGQISHIKCYGRRNWGKAHSVLDLIDRANSQGLDISADQYPYTGCYSGLLGHVLHRKYRDLLTQSGPRRLLRRDLREEVRRDMADCLALVGGPRQLIICPMKPMPELDGKRLSEFLKSPTDLEGLVDLLRQVDPRVPAICMVMCERDLETFMRDSRVMTGSDGQLREPGDGFSHPRNFGTFPRVLARYVRDRKVLRLEHAVHRATALPARRLGFRERGVLSPGRIADVVVFDLAKIRDTATFRRSRGNPRGIPFVFVAGNPAVERGKPTARGHGRVLRRGEG